MDLKNIVSITGMSGLYNLISTRNNGLIVEDMEQGKRSFVSIRKHQFTPLESIGIYTYTDVVDLSEVFDRMKKIAGEEKIPSASDPGGNIVDFFRKVIPDYDEDKVFLSDMKKLLKWYEFLGARGLLDRKSSDEEE